MQLGGTSFTTPKPPVNIELFIQRYMGYFNGFKFIGNLSPYIALLSMSYCSTAPISYPAQWMILPSIYIYVCIKINGVTSISTQNKSHTTYLYLPSIILYATYTINPPKLIHIIHLYRYVDYINILNTFNLNYLFYINIY